MTAQIIRFPGRSVRASWADSAQPLRDYEKQILRLAQMMIDRGLEAGQSLEQIKKRLARGPEPGEDAAMVDLHIEIAAEVERRLRAERQLDPSNSGVTTLPKMRR